MPEGKSVDSAKRNNLRSKLSALVISNHHQGNHAWNLQFCTPWSLSLDWFLLHFSRCHLAISKVASPKLKPYIKTVLDVAALDGIGGNGVRRLKPRLSMKRSSFDEKPEFKTPQRTYMGTLGRSKSRASAHTSSTATLNRMKMPAMPKLPVAPIVEPEDDTNSQVMELQRRKAGKVTRF